MIDLKYVLAAMDPQRALDISMFSEKSDPNALTADQLAQMKAKADEVTKDCKNNLEKLKALQNFVIKNTTYDNNGNGRNDPYGAFSGGVCVCQGYANILKVLLYTQGIPCIGINGNLFQGDVYLGAHAWDYVYADGKWNVNDPTNGGFFEMDKVDTYKHLQPLRTDIEDYFSLVGQRDERSLLEAMMALPATPDIELELPDRTLDGSADRIPDFLDETA